MVNVIVITKHLLYIDVAKLLLLEKNIRILEAVPDLGQGLVMLETRPCDVVLIDIRWDKSTTGLPLCDMVSLIRQVQRDCPIVGISTFFDENHVAHLQNCGAQGYFYKTVSQPLQQLAEVLAIVASGGKYYCPKDPDLAVDEGESDA